jgi:hypothetical protein
MVVKLARDEAELRARTAYLAQITGTSPGGQATELQQAAFLRFKEMRAMLDEGYQMIASVEPKSHPGIEERRSELGELEDDFSSLQAMVPKGSGGKTGAIKSGSKSGARRPKHAQQQPQQ